MADLLSILALPLALATANAAEVPTPTEPIQETVQVDTSGFIYGRVETRHDTYEGRLVWRRDRFWNDFLDATKSRRPHARQLPREATTRTHSIEIFGRTFERESHDPGGRSMRIRYGDIARLEPHSTAWTTIVLRDGREIDAEGGRDISRPVTVIDAEGEATRVDWRRIRSVVFLPTPSDLSVDEHRLYGTVTYRRAGETVTTDSYFRWDRDETSTVDVLDGYTPDRTEHEIPFGEIRRLEQKGDATLVTLIDDRELLLDGTNDVDASNRGLDLERSGGGRQTILWMDLVSIDLQAPPGSGLRYDDFPPPAPLTGTVTTASGETVSGWLAFDADEDATWEILDVVDVSGGDVAIPFGRVESIERSNANRDLPWRVALIDGETVESKAEDDLGDRNPGMLVYTREADEAPPRFVPWDEVARIDFTNAGVGEAD